MSRQAAVAALVAYLLALAAATLGAPPGALFDEGALVAHRIDGLEWVTSTSVERAANVVLFIPAGFLLCAALPRTNRWLVWLVCASASAAVETVQYALPGRDSSPIDVVTNSTGAAIGVLVHVALTRRRHDEARPPHPQT